jgi:ubiquinone/menaquinone biosynthesis C-methylase UbiE
MGHQRPRRAQKTVGVVNAHPASPICETDGARRIIQAHWNSQAGVFDDLDGHGLSGEAQRRAWSELLAPLTGVAPQRVLDVGCGTGFMAIAFARLGHSVIGVDFAPKMVEQARRKASRERLEIDFRVGDAVALDDDDGAFDVVAARHVLWNLPDPGRGVDEWLRVLKPGGRLAIVEGTWAERAPKRGWRRIRASIVAVAVKIIAAPASRTGRPYPPRIRTRLYRQVESALPFFGGLSADRLCALLNDAGVEGVEVLPLTDPALWGESPRYPRYLALGIRPHEAA